MTSPSRSERMSRTWDRIRTEPGLARNTFVTAALLVLALVAGGIILSQQRFIAPWQDRYVVYATFAASPGISPGQGQEVRIAGVQVGQIVSADVDDAGQARLELSLNGEFKGKVYDNAHVILRPKSPLNEMYVIMNPGGPPGQPLPNKGTLPVGNSERPIQFDELLGNLDDNARTMLTSLLSESDIALVNAQKTLPGGLDAVRLVGNDLRPVSDELAKRKEKLRTLVTALGEIAKGVGHDDKRLRQLGDGLQSTLGTLSANDKDLESSLGQLPDLLSQLRRATDSVQGLADELDPALRNLETASDQFPKALKALESTSDQLDGTVQEAGPFMDEAKTALEDLRPFVGEAKKATGPLHAATRELSPITQAAIPFLPDLGAFITQTRSIVSLADANTGILRGVAEFSPQTVPPVLGPNNGLKPLPDPLSKGTTALQKAVPVGPGGVPPIPQDGSNIKSSKPAGGLVPALPKLPFGNK